MNILAHLLCTEEILHPENVNCTLIVCCIHCSFMFYALYKILFFYVGENHGLMQTQNIYSYVMVK